MKNRYVELDILRSVGILWIVGFWHLFDYTEYTIKGFFASYFTESIMATFFFLSGFLLNKHKQLITLEDKKRFIIKRFIGFQIPFMISVITLFPLNWFDSGTQALLTITGLSAFSPPMAGTLWFSSVLLVYYALGFIVLSIQEGKMRMFVSAILIGTSLMLVLIIHDSPKIDFRIITYSIIYIISLNIQPDKIFSIQKKYRWYIIAICIIVIFVVCIWKNNSIKKTIGYISFVLFMLMLSIQLMSMRLLKNKTLLSSIISKIGIASSFAYFFHRQYFIVIRAILKRFFGVMEINIWFAYVFILPVFFFICYYLSILYNHYTRKIVARMNFNIT